MLATGADAQVQHPNSGRDERSGCTK